MKKGEWYACRCCTPTGNCTKDVHDEIINKKKSDGRLEKVQGI